VARAGALRATAVVFGVMAGLGGIRHGIGEILQGNVAPAGILIDSWIHGPIAERMEGEPAMSLVPNLLVTGILAVVISSVVIIWAVAGIRRRRGGLVLLLLSFAMLLFGGGFGPPITGLLAGVAGLGVNPPLTWWRTHMPSGLQRALAALWPWVFGIAVANGLFLFVVSLVLVLFTDLNNPDLFLYSFYLVVVTVLLSTMTGIAYDIRREGEP